ncbi:hypothetical protein [Frondihabitans cladoniiphilus]|uniref:Uncharacterized protein n=1 Tax=Frondihabitans cladoniiphilus TaxID=715785 RepID=A0ABP8VJF4_9MICO
MSTSDATPGLEDEPLETQGPEAEGPDSFDGEGAVEHPAGPRAVAVLLLVAGVIFAWSIYAAVGNLTQVPAQFDAYRDFVTKGGAPELAKTTPWPALIAVLLVPVVGYLVALRLGRGRSLRVRLVSFALTYAAVCALTVSLTAYVFKVSSLL